MRTPAQGRRVQSLFQLKNGLHLRRGRNLPTRIPLQLIQRLADFGFQGSDTLASPLVHRMADAEFHDRAAQGIRLGRRRHRGKDQQ